MASGIEFHQIYWKDEQLKGMFDFAIPYYNETLTEFFENLPIAKIVSASNAKKIAVCSHALKAKYKPGLPPIGDITIDRLSSEFDVMAFTRNSKHHDMIAAMDVWHPGTREILRQICEKIGLKWWYNRPLAHPIYQNAFCARAEVYKEYVQTALIPAMKVMEHDKTIRDLCWVDAGYEKLKGPNQEWADRIRKFLNVPYCPLHPFLLERLFSVWIEGRKLNVVIV